MNRATAYKNISDIFNTETKPNLSIIETRKSYINTSNPSVWGPGLWLFLHISSAHYPINPDKSTKEFAICTILGLPSSLPCANCSSHSKSYIESRKNQLGDICSSRMKYFNFFVDLHNFVNQRLNKKLYTYEEAWKMYSGGVDILNFQY